MGGFPRVAVADPPDGRGARGLPRWAMLARAVLWIAAAAVLAGLIVSRYRGAITTAPLTNGGGGDFRTFFDAGRTVARGGNLYPPGGTYVYFAPLALLLSLFSDLGPVAVLKGWTVAELAAFAAAVGLLVYALRNRLPSWWEAPILFAFCAVTGLHLWAMTFEFFISNDDIFVLLTLVLAGIALRDDHPSAFGILVGVAMLIKVWPVLLIVAVLQRGIRARDRIAAVLALAGVGVVGLVTNLIPAGTRELKGFFITVNRMKAQNQILSKSVGGIPRILFAQSGLGKPLFVSSDVRYLATGLLGLWVLGKLVLCLRRPGDRMLVVFNVMLFAVLIDPVSHLAYSILALPIIWFWVAHYRVFLDRRGWRGRELAVRILVGAAVAVWYLVQQKAWPDSPNASSLSESPVFLVNLFLLTASVLGGRMLLRRAEPTTERATAQRSISTTQRSQPAQQVAPSS